MARSTKTINRIHEILDSAKEGDSASRYFDIFIVTLIILNVFALILETVKSIHELMPEFFYWFEFVSVIIFTIEYLLRIWSGVVVSGYRSPIKGRIKYMLKPMLIIDLLAILPFYLPFLEIDLRSIRAIRLFRIFRLAKLSRYSQALRLIKKILSNKKAELIVTTTILLLLLLFSSSLMYFAENKAQPNVFSSIPHSMWWAVATLTTVGYGDAYPVTALGKFLASIIAILGIGMFALPTGILGSAFVEEVQQKQREKEKTICPHCKKEID